MVGKEEDDIRAKEKGKKGNFIQRGKRVKLMKDLERDREANTTAENFEEEKSEVQARKVLDLLNQLSLIHLTSERRSYRPLNLHTYKVICIT